ncbi:unnamed protein product [Paramecium primaurelia]|uniref:Leucine Rich Repeat family protein n=1 Tax=Paramecium primaurelia TaxID=5886 RepID=A0A8S1MLE0_PARPR|nr:unnamed protein product [Paramecium primaurelia]
MYNKFKPIIMDDTTQGSIDSKSIMFLTASPSQYKTKQQVILSRKLSKLEPLIIEKDKRSDSRSQEKQLSYDLGVTQVQDWKSFMQKDADLIKEFNETTEKIRRSSIQSQHSQIFMSSTKIDKNNQSQINDRRSSINLKSCNNDDFLEKMKLGNKQLPNLTTTEFMKCVRQKEKLTEYAKVYQQSPQNIYLKLNNSQNYVPKTFGLVTTQGNQLIQVNASRYLRNIDDCKVYAEAMKTTQSQGIQKMQLNNNIYDPIQFKELLSSFPNTIRELELKDCKLNFKHIDTLMAYINKNLILKLNLEQNLLRDQGCNILMKHLMNNNTLQCLNLCNNKITESSSVALSNFLKQSQRLLELYLGFNNLQINGSIQIWKAMYKNTSIKIFDMSHNAIASLECAQAIAKALSRSYNELVHIDIRYNKFNQQQSLIIAEGLIKNETIYGFHFEGNYQDIIMNSNGFLINRKEEMKLKKQKIEQLNKQPQYFKLLDEDKQEDQNKLKTDEDLCLAYHRSRRIKSTELNIQKINMINKLDVCWICEGWQEIKFYWNKKSGTLKSEPIFIHFDFDDYQPYLMTFLNGEFFFVKMCPPNRSIKYFFTNPILGIQCVAEDQNILYLNKPLPSIPFLYNNEILVDGNTMQMINELISPSNQVLFDRYVPLVQAKPRETMTLFDFSPYLNVASIKWSVETSIFRYFPPDTDKLIEECFEFDYQNSKINRLVKETELQDVKDILKQFYVQIFNCYKYFASGNSTAPIPCLGPSDYVEFLISTDVIEGVKPNDIDIGFTSTAGAKDVSFPQAYEKGIVRCQLMEVLVRFCNDKYIRSGMCQTMTEGLSQLQQQCQEFLSKFDTSQAWRKMRLWNEKCDILIRDRMPMIKILYKYTCKLSKKPQQYKYDYISPQDFRDFLKQSNVICDELTERECYLAYLQSMITQKDELFSPKHYQMNLYEFIEAIARIAEKVSIIRGEKVLEIEYRRAQDLQDKIAGLLLLMYLTLIDEIKKALPNEPDIKHLENCMNNDFRSKKQKLEDSFTDGDEPPYDVKVELPILIAQVPNIQGNANGPAKRMTIRNIKLLKPSITKYSLTNFVQFFISLNERT